MIPPVKRPFGITLMSVVFLWIGGFGSIFLPIVIATSSLNRISQVFLGKWIHLPALLHFISFVALFTWLSLYVLYAFIGWGLWKLRNWARRAAIAVSVFGIVLFIAMLPLYLRLGMPVWAILPVMTAPMIGLIFYLCRPRVLYAFGVLPILPGALPLAGQPAPLSNLGRAAVVLCVVTVVVLFATGLAWSIEQEFRESDAYKIALTQAEHSPCVTDRLGFPLVPNGSLGGNFETSRDRVSANLEIPIKGPKGEGNLEVSATKQEGVWTINKLLMVHADITSTIVPARPSGCQ